MPPRRARPAASGARIDEVLAGLDLHGPGGDDVVREIARDASLTADWRALVLGGGGGRSACQLAREKGCAVVTAPGSDPLVAAARARVARDGLADRVTVRKAPLEELPRPFKAGHFDLVFWEDPLALADFEATIRAARKLLRPGGTLAAIRLTWVAPPAPDLHRAADALRPGDPARTMDEYLVALADADYGGGVAWPLGRAAWDRWLGPLEAAADRLGAGGVTPPPGVGRGARGPLPRPKGASQGERRRRRGGWGSDPRLERLDLELRLFRNPATRAALDAMAFVAQRQEAG